MIILTFCARDGIKIPQYTYYCLSSLRKYNPSEQIVFISNRDNGFGTGFRNLGIENICMSEIQSEQLSLFQNVSNLRRHGTPNTKYPSPPEFFYRAMERIYYLHAFMAQYSVSNAIHLENDVLVYDSMKNAGMDPCCSYVTPLGDSVSTFAFCQFNLSALTRLCEFMTEVSAMNESDFMGLTGSDMFNEMSALSYFVKTHEGTIENLPTICNNGGYIFDPGSWGQFLGGTNNEHGAGWYGQHHFIGRHIHANPLLAPKMIDGKPYSGDNPIFNLHIHSKNLRDFVCN